MQRYLLLGGYNMSDIDFQNGFLCGMATRGLTKANVDLAFLNEHKYYFVTDTLLLKSAVDSLFLITDNVATDVKPAIAGVGNEILNLTSLIETIAENYMDLVVEEIL